MSPTNRAVVGGLVAALVVMGALAGFLWVSLSDLKVRYGVLSAKHSALEERYAELSNKYSSLSNEYSGLRARFEGLKSNYTALEGKYEALAASYSELREEHSALQRNYTSLKKAYEALETKYGELNSTYVRLKAEHKELTAKYEELKAELNSLSRTYSSLLSNYTSLRNAYSSLKSEYGDLQARYSDLSNEYLTLQEKYGDLLRNVEGLMNVTEERAGLINSFKPNFIDWESSLVIKAVRSVNFNAYSDPYEAILEWIVKHIYYSFDTPEVVVTSPNATYEWVTDYYQYASETLRNGYGDCEDQAILAAAMVEAYWSMEYGDTYLLWVVEATVTYGGVRYGHAFLIIPFQGNEVAILDPAMQVYVPPTNTLTALQEYEQLTGVHITYVYGVFSPWKYYYVGASTLSEFAQWLNTH